MATHMSCARHRPSTGLCVNERFLTCVNDMSGYIRLIVHVTAFEISTCFFVTPLLSCFFSLINAINTATHGCVRTLPSGSTVGNGEAKYNDFVYYILIYIICVMCTSFIF